MAENRIYETVQPAIADTGRGLHVTPRAIRQRRHAPAGLVAAMQAPVRPSPAPPTLEGTLVQVHELVELALDKHRARSTSSNVQIEVHAAGWRAIAGDLLSAARSEFLLVTSGRSRCSDEQLAQSTRIAATLLHRDVTLRHVFTPDSLSRRSVRAYAEAVARGGGSVRVSSEPIQDIILIDRRVALVWGAPGADLEQCIAVRGTVLLDSVVKLSDAVWKTAKDFAVHKWLDDDGDDDDLSILKILNMLAAGHTDEVSARRLGISVRTYRRRVANIMERLGASSRFEAGVRAAQIGIVDTALAGV